MRGAIGPINIILGCWTLGILLYLSDQCNAEEKATMTPLTFPMDCKKYHQRGMKFLLKNFNKCSRELRANITQDKEYEEKIGCALKCTMRNTGYSENDLVTEASMRRAAGSVLPNVLVEPLVQELLRTCHSKYGDKLDPLEEYCKSYSEYAFCIQNAVADIVESDVYEMYCIKEEKKKIIKS